MVSMMELLITLNVIIISKIKWYLERTQHSSTHKCKPLLAHKRTHTDAHTHARNPIRWRPPERSNFPHARTTDNKQQRQQTTVLYLTAEDCCSEVLQWGTARRAGTAASVLAMVLWVWCRDGGARERRGDGGACQRRGRRLSAPVGQESSKD